MNCFLHHTFHHIHINFHLSLQTVSHHPHPLFHLSTFDFMFPDITHTSISLHSSFLCLFLSFVSASIDILHLYACLRTFSYTGGPPVVILEPRRDTFDVQIRGSLVVRCSVDSTPQAQVTWTFGTNRQLPPNVSEALLSMS